MKVDDAALYSAFIPPGQAGAASVPNCSCPAGCNASDNESIVFAPVYWWQVFTPVYTYTNPPTGTGCNCGPVSSTPAESWQPAVRKVQRPPLPPPFIVT